MPEEQLYDQPRFSHAARARRWTAVRQAMERANIDCLIAPNNTGHSTHFQAEARYLSHVGGGGDADIAVVFPLEGEVAAVARSCARSRCRASAWASSACRATCAPRRGLSCTVSCAR